MVRNAYPTLPPPIYDLLQVQPTHIAIAILKSGQLFDPNLSLA